MTARKSRTPEELDALVAKHFPKSRDLTLTILKGHLLAEENMDKLLEVSVPDSSHIFGARLGFAQRLKVLRSLHPDPHFQAVAEAAELLNEVRNTLAHQLEPTRQDVLIPIFIRAAYNAAGVNPKPLGSDLRRTEKAPKKVSRTSLTSALAIVIGRLGFFVHEAQKNAA